MGNSPATGSTTPAPTAESTHVVDGGSKGPCNPKVSPTTGKRICCVCKETKAARDECIVMNGEDKCRQFILAHNQCLRAEGFEVEDK